MSVLSKYMANPRNSQYEALKWVLRYDKGSLNHGLIYGGRADILNHFIKVYIDANYAVCCIIRNIF